MTPNLFDSGLDRNAANFSPLSPLPFLEAGGNRIPVLARGSPRRAGATH